MTLDFRPALLLNALSQLFILWQNVGIIKKLKYLK